MSYKYEQLPDPLSYFRVLTLERGNFGDPLKGSLSIEKFSAKPAYEAISYFWGALDTAHRIELRQGSSSVSTAITENLSFALRRLRSTSEDRRLWTDAISINQTDEDEKSHQVRHMTQIYRDAKTVLIYLGEQESNTQQAFELLNQIYIASKATPRGDTRSSLRWILDNNLPTVDEPLAWEPLKAFYRRPWFRRKWTIQEAVVASEALVICGDSTADWDLLEVVHLAIYKHSLAVLDHTTYHDQTVAKELQQGLAQMNSLVSVKNLWGKNGRYELMDLVYHFQTARATDPRDHLFALLALSAEAYDPELQPQYKLTTLQNAEKYANHFLRRKGNLEILYRAGLHGYQSKLPSWIPDWCGGSDSFAFEYAQGPWDPLRRHLRRHSFYRVAPGSHVQLLEPTSPGVLGIRGACIDSIRELANIHLKQGEHLRLTKAGLLEQTGLNADESDAIISKLTSYPSGEDLGEVQWRTLICNVAFDLTKAPADYADSYHAWRRTYQRAGSVASGTDFALARRFREVIDAYNSDKIFGASKNGSVGMFPRAARAGDQIYILFGGEFPFLLRKINGSEHYQLVGQCYIHGIMNGELDWEKFTAEDVYLA